MTVTAVRPSHVWAPDAQGSDAEDVSAVADLIGRPLDGFQHAAVDTLSGCDRAGVPVALEQVIVAPRQNGKTGGVILPIVLAEALFGEPDLIVWTAHRFDTAEKVFEDIRSMVEVSADGDPVNPVRFVPALASRVAKLRQSNGDMGFTFTNGSELEFQARSGRAGRGKSGRVVVIDEALYFTGDQAGALLPLLATRPGARILYGSSGARSAESDYLRALVKRGRAGGDPSLAYVEWCAPGSWDDPGCPDGPRCLHDLGTPGCALDDEGLWAAANPAVGRPVNGISPVFLRSMRRTLPPVEFGREFLGWHEAGEDDEETISPAEWLKRVDPLSRAADRARPTFAFDVRPDMGAAAVAIAVARDDGSTHVGVIRHRAGTGWLVDELVELRAKHRPRTIVLDGASQSAGLIPDLERRGLRVRSKSQPGGVLVVTSAADMGSACGGLRRAVVEDTVWHRGDRLVTDALGNAARRHIGDGGWGWARKHTDADITALVAVTLAHWGLATGPPSVDMLKSFG